MKTFSTLASAALLLASAVNGHMVMKTPTPFGNPNNSPLDPSGSDFPCKGGPYDRGSVSNIMAIGEPQTLSFTGSAVHGGGSCQVSLTTDLQPTKDTKWMVIKSIEGGCPASVAGNLPEDPNGNGASTFQYTIPEGVAPGEYVVAWTWINKIGNREFYMNCGPATVTGAKKKRYAPAGVSLARRQSSFPDMFVANIASVNDCKTPESFDYNYPNPGEAVESAGTGPYTALACGAAGGNNPAPQPTGAAGGGAGGAGGSGTQPSDAPAAPTGDATAPGSGTAPGGGSEAGPGSAPGSGSDSGSGAPPQGGPGGPGGNGGNGGTRTGAPGSFATGAAPLPEGVGSVPESGSTGGSDAPPAAGADTESPAAPEAPAPVAPEAPAGPTAPAPAAPESTGTVTPPAGGSAGAQSGPCTSEGDWVCLAGGQQYQRCASGAWTVPQSVAAGTQCTPGAPSANFQISRLASPKYKRDPKRVAL